MKHPVFAHIFGLTARVYDILKWLAMQVIPATGILYVALASVFHWPYSDQVLATAASLSGFLGLYLKLSFPKEDPSTEVKQVLSDVVYDFLVQTAKVVLPGFATLYVAIAQAWGLPYVTEIVGVLTAGSIYITMLVGLSKAQYDKSFTGQS